VGAAVAPRGWGQRGWSHPVKEELTARRTGGRRGGGRAGEHEDGRRRQGPEEDKVMGHTFPYHMIGRGSNFELSSVNTKNPERV
jgi:hypothetical protein